MAAIAGGIISGIDSGGATWRSIKQHDARRQRQHRRMSRRKSSVWQAIEQHQTAAATMTATWQ